MLRMYAEKLRFRFFFGLFEFFWFNLAVEAHFALVLCFCLGLFFVGLKESVVLCVLSNEKSNSCFRIFYGLVRVYVEDSLVFVYIFVGATFWKLIELELFAFPVDFWLVYILYVNIWGSWLMIVRFDAVSSFKCCQFPFHDNKFWCSSV